MDSFLRAITNSLFADEEQREIVLAAIYGVINHTLLPTLVLIAVCEVASYKTVRELRKTKEGRDLHNSGIATTLFNFIGLGIPIHVMARLTVPANETPRESTWQVLLRITAFVILQNFSYYFAHMAMHLPSLYWMHRYHHRYNRYVTPSSANAVTIAEFLFAYVIPPAIITAIVQPTESEGNTAMCFISIFNILVHTPCIEEWSERNLPVWWVGANIHGEHHRRITKNYASPCLNLDFLLGSSHKAEKDM